MIDRLLAFIIILATLLFGSVEIWSSTLIIFMVYTLGLVWMLKGEYKSDASAMTDKMFMLTAAAFIAFILLQTVPLPSIIVNFISPASYRIWEGYSFSEQKFMPISIHPYKTLSEIPLIIAFFIMFFISMINFKKIHRLKELIKILSIFGFVIAVFAIVQKGTWNGKLYWFRELTLGGVPFGPFVNRNHFSGLIGMLIPLCLSISIANKHKEDKILYGFCTVVMSIALFFSLSRGGIISFFGGIFLFSLLIIVSRVQEKRIWAIGFFLSVLFFYLAYLGIDPIIQRFYETDITTEERLVAWSAALNAFRDFWPFGSGIGTIINLYPLYLPVGVNTVYDHAHNDYLEFIVETGVAGIILLLIFTAVLIYSIAKSGFHGSTGILRIGAVSSAFSMAIHSIFDFNLHILSNLLLFSVVLGLIAALAHISEQKSDIKKTAKMPDA